MITTQLATRQQRALDRALLSGLCARVERFSDSEYIVPSATQCNRWYVVEVAGESYGCNCAAGQNGQPCAHSAAVWRVVHGLVLSRVQLRGAAN